MNIRPFISDVIKLAESPTGKLLLGYLCPACCEAHYVPIEEPNSAGAVWTWDGNPDRPTPNPSHAVNVVSNHRCNHFITEGQIQFMDDCGHSMAGQIVDLPKWPTTTNFQHEN